MMAFFIDRLHPSAISWSAVMRRLLRIRPALLSLCLLLVQTAPVAAHNGAVALARPLEGIVVDGELDDWPDGLERYPIARWEMLSPPADETDFRAFFRIGYSRAVGALFLAVEVTDGTIRSDTAGVARDAWWDLDACEIYISDSHPPDSLAAFQYALRGTGQRVKAAVDGRIVPWSGATAVVRQQDDRLYYEWRLDLAEPDSLRAGRVVNLDVAVFDGDEGGESDSYLKWGPGLIDPRSQPSGDVYLAGSDLQTGRLKGVLRWEGGEGVRRGRLAVVAEEPELHWELETDSEGHFSLDVPPGQYRLEPAALGRGDKPQASIAVTAGGQAQVVLEVPLPQGKRIEFGPGKGRWQHFGEADGLPSMHTNRVARDRQGFMWFASTYAGSQGVVRYDGERFVLFAPADGLAHPVIKDLYGDRTGAMWFGTEGHGASRYDGQIWTTFTTADGLAGNRVNAICEDDSGEIWFGTEGQGASRYDGQIWTTFTTADGLAGNTVEAIFSDDSGALWFGTKEGGVSRYAGGQWQTFTIEDGLAGTHVRAIEQDGDGALWFGTRLSGVSRYAGGQWQTFTAEDGLGFNRIFDIHRDRAGHLWFGFAVREAGLPYFSLSGVSRYDGRRFETVSLEDNPHRNEVYSIAEDLEGGLWFGTWGGASRYEPDGWRVFTTENGLPDNLVYTLRRDRDNQLWFIFGDGSLYRHDGPYLTRFGRADGFGEMPFSLYEDRRGHLWFSAVFGRGNDFGLSRYNGQTVAHFTPADGLPQALIQRSEGLLEDRQGRLWVGTEDGISRYDGRTFTPLPELGALGQEILGMAEDSRGRIWFAGGNVDVGVSRYDGQILETFTTADGLGHNQVYNILEDSRGRLWFGTIGGLSQYEDQAAAEDGPQFTNFSVSDGLTSNNINSLYEDSHGHLWIGTWGGGFNRFDGQVFQNLTAADGLPANTAHFNPMVAEDGQGYIWIGTSEGLVRYRPSRTQPPVFITDVQTDRRHGPVEKLRLPSSQGLLAVEFHGLSFRTRPGQMAYGYRLVGYQDAWQWTRERRVEYTDLPVGQYTFEVQAVDRDLNYSAEPATVQVEVFYQPQGSPVRLAQIQLDDLFASFYSTYAHQPFGQIHVANDAPQKVEATLRFFLPGLMRHPFDQRLKLLPQATERIDLTVPFDAQLLAHTDAASLYAEIELAFAGDEETLTRRQTHPITLNGRGALRWDDVARAAAFITPTDPAVAGFTRPTLVAFEALIDQQGTPLRNLSRALVLFQALKAQGLRYVPDANTPYAQVATDRAAVDHIQYPADLLQTKAGDCDDLTVLFCALLENVGVATALVDYPGHLFLLLDSGLSRQQVDLFPVDDRLFLLWGDRLWLPLEVTLLDQAFHQAWRAGAEQLAGLPPEELLRRLQPTAQAWERFPPAVPPSNGTTEPPDRTTMSPVVDAQYAQLQQLVDAYIDEHFLYPLQAHPDDEARRKGLLQLYLALQRYDTAIRTAQDHLLDEEGDPARTYNQLGIAYFLKGDLREAALRFKRAAGLRPEDGGIRANLERTLEVLGRAQAAPTDSLAMASRGETKAGATGLSLESFYWME